MSEVTLTNEQYRQAVLSLIQHGQFRNGTLVCDDDDIHEYLVSDGLLVQNHETNTDESPESFQWLSDESLERIRNTTIDFHINDGNIVNF